MESFPLGSSFSPTNRASFEGSFSPSFLWAGAFCDVSLFSLFCPWLFWEGYVRFPLVHAGRLSFPSSEEPFDGEGIPFDPFRRGNSFLRLAVFFVGKVPLLFYSTLFYRWRVPLSPSRQEEKRVFLVLSLTGPGISPLMAKAPFSSFSFKKKEVFIRAFFFSSISFCTSPFLG